MKVRWSVCFRVNVINKLLSTSYISFIPAYDNGHTFNQCSLFPAVAVHSNQVLSTSLSPNDLEHTLHAKVSNDAILPHSG
jgi:hypothetical protein